METTSDNAKIRAELAELRAEVSAIKADMASSKMLQMCHSETMGLLETIKTTQANIQTPINSKPPKAGSGSKSGGKSNAYPNRRVAFKKWYIAQDPVLKPCLERFHMQLENFQLEKAAEFKDEPEERKKGKIAEFLYKLVQGAGDYKDSTPLGIYYNTCKASHDAKQKAEAAPPSIVSTQPFEVPPFNPAPLSTPPTPLSSGPSS